MSLLSFLRKNKQDSDTDDSTFYSRAEEDSKAVRSRRRTRGKAEGNADPVLPEKKRARRRLIGAVALVLAAVVGLPMILDSEPKPLADDIDIRIPSREKAAPPAAPAKPAEHQAALDEREEVVEPAPRAPQAAPRTEAAAAAEERAAPARPAPVPPKAEPRPDAKPEVKPQPKPEARPQPKPEARTADTQEDARARALLEGKGDPKADKKDSGKYVIQVAALATKEKVNELQSKLKGAGIKSYTQTVSTASGERTRIRVGPFASKDEAEKVRARIVEIGLNGTLVPA